MNANEQRKSNLSDRLGDCLVDLRQVAQVLGVSERSVYRLIAANELPQPVKVGSSTRFYQSDIQAYLQGLRLQSGRA